MNTAIEQEKPDPVTERLLKGNGVGLAAALQAAQKEGKLPAPPSMEELAEDLKDVAEALLADQKDDADETLPAETPLVAPTQSPSDVSVNAEEALRGR